MDFFIKEKQQLWSMKRTGSKFAEINISILSLLEDSWNFMPPILVPSSAKYIPTQILVIAKVNGNSLNELPVQS